MKNPVSLSPRAALFIGVALLSTPALGQEQTVAPPPVVSTVPAPAPAPAAPPAVTFAPAAPTVQDVPAAPVAEAPAPARRAAASTPARTTRTVTRSTTTTAARTVAQPAAPVAEPVPAAPPPAETVQTAPPPGPEQVAPAPEAAAPAPAPIRPTPIWPFALLGALILAGAIFFLMRRRRPEYDDVVEDEAYAEPVIAPEPLVVATPVKAQAEPQPAIAEPMVETEAVATEAAKEDLAGVTGGVAPVAHRPWLEFGMRPVRAGTSEDEAMVEIELTVGNSGDMPAEDVRITTFMLADGDASEIEKMLTGHHDDELASMSIAAGEGTRVDATFAAPKSEIGETFTPVVVADARYRLPDGTEGRTAAAFRIGRSGESGISPIGAMRPQIVSDVGAELDQLLERA